MVDKFKLEGRDLRQDLCFKYMVEKSNFYGSSGVQEFWVHSPKETEKKKRHSITVEIHHNEESKKLIIRGNLRKWYFGRNNLADLNFFKFIKAMNRLSFLVFGDQNKIWTMNFTQLELGFNFQLLISAKGIFNSIVAYSTFRRIIYENETVKFEGSGYSVIFYDKLKEIINDYEEYYKTTRPIFHGLRKLHTKAVFPRFEVQINRMTQSQEFMRLCRTPENLRDNYDEVIDLVHKKFKNMTYMDELSPYVISSLKGKRRRAIQEFFMYVGMKSIGEVETLSIVNGVNRDKKRFREVIELIYERHSSMSRTTIKKEFRQTASRRVKELKCIDNRMDL